MISVGPFLVPCMLTIDDGAIIAATPTYDWLSKAKLGGNDKEGYSLVLPHNFQYVPVKVEITEKV